MVAECVPVCFFTFLFFTFLYTFVLANRTSRVLVFLNAPCYKRWRWHADADKTSVAKEALIASVDTFMSPLIREASCQPRMGSFTANPLFKRMTYKFFPFCLKGLGCGLIASFHLICPFCVYMPKDIFFSFAYFRVSLSRRSLNVLWKFVALFAEDKASILASDFCVYFYCCHCLYSFLYFFCTYCHTHSFLIVCNGKAIFRDEPYQNSLKKSILKFWNQCRILPECVCH